MSSGELKTRATDADVAAFLDAVPDARRRAEGHALDALHRKVSGEEPRMWGPSIVGYGRYAYGYDSGREDVAPRAGFSPRRAAAVVCLNGDLGGAREAEAAALEGLVRLGWDAKNARYPA